MSGHPIGFVDYACGHSTPVHGTGGTVSRPCQLCAAGRLPVKLAQPITITIMMGRVHTQESPNV
jgi:hypothetical protein